MDLKRFYQTGLISFITASSFLQTVYSEEKEIRAIYYPLVYEKETSGFGHRIHPINKKDRIHEGVDLYAKKGTDVFSIFDGKVTYSGYLEYYGNTVVIEHKNNVTSHYCHLSKIEVEAGDKLEAGDILGKVGQTGEATGPHLHFEIRKNGKPIDPVIIFPGLKS